MATILQHPKLSLAQRKKTRSLIERAGDWFRRRSAQITDRRAFDTLTRLDDRELRDIGLTREDVEWASKLPLSWNAAQAMRERAKKR